MRSGVSTIHSEQTRVKFHTARQPPRLPPHVQRNDCLHPLPTLEVVRNLRSANSVAEVPAIIRWISVVNVLARMITIVSSDVSALHLSTSSSISNLNRCDEGDGIRCQLPGSAHGRAGKSITKQRDGTRRRRRVKADARCTYLRTNAPIVLAVPPEVDVPDRAMATLWVLSTPANRCSVKSSSALVSVVESSIDLGSWIETTLSVW